MADEEPVVDLARSQPFRLGALEVDPPRRRVSTGETLEPRVMQVLVALARARGAVVSRDELIRTCWDGRIVGEDSITRVIGALRRLAEDRGGGAFRIETVPKVGYRLVGDVLPVVSADVVQSGSGTAVPAPPAPVGRRWLVPAVAAAIVTAGIGGVAVWRGGHADAERVTVHFTGYKPLSAAVPVGLPDAIADATLSAFTEDGRVAVTSGNGGGEFRLGGSIDRAGDVMHVASRVDDARTGVTLWSRVLDVPVAQQARLATRTAAMTVQLARCALSQQAIHGKPLSDEVLTLLFAECAAEMSEETHNKALDLARQITEIQPDLASGWSSRAFAANGNSRAAPPAAAAPLRAEARMAMDKALALDPRDSRAWHVKVYTVPETDLTGIDRAYRNALKARPSECGCVFMDYGIFLLSSGRTREAREMFQRAHDTMPLHPSPLAGLGRIYAGEGRVAEARATFDKLDALSAGPRETSQVVISNALWTKDYAGALKSLLANPLQGPPGLAKAIDAGFRALLGGDAESKRAAAAVLLRESADCACNGAFNARMIAALGDAPAAFATISQLAIKHPFHTREAVSWDPVFAEVRRQPGFPALANRLGLINYWRTLKIKPDYCGTAGAPPVCAMI